MEPDWWKGQSPSDRIAVQISKAQTPQEFGDALRALVSALESAGVEPQAPRAARRPRTAKKDADLGVPKPRGLKHLYPAGWLLPPGFPRLILGPDAKLYSMGRVTRQGLTKVVVPVELDVEGLWNRHAPKCRHRPTHSGVFVCDADYDRESGNCWDVSSRVWVFCDAALRLGWRPPDLPHPDYPHIGF